MAIEMIGDQDHLQGMVNMVETHQGEILHQVTRGATLLMINQATITIKIRATHHLEEGIHLRIKLRVPALILSLISILME